jgi:hypothetical protein
MSDIVLFLIVGGICLLAVAACGYWLSLCAACYNVLWSQNGTQWKLLWLRRLLLAPWGIPWYLWAGRPGSPWCDLRAEPEALSSSAQALRGAVFAGVNYERYLTAGWSFLIPLIGVLSLSGLTFFMVLGAFHVLPALIEIR